MLSNISMWKLTLKCLKRSNVKAARQRLLGGGDSARKYRDLKNWKHEWVFSKQHASAGAGHFVLRSFMSCYLTHEHSANTDSEPGGQGIGLSYRRWAADIRVCAPTNCDRQDDDEALKSTDLISTIYAIEAQHSTPTICLFRGSNKKAMQKRPLKHCGGTGWN